MGDMGLRNVESTLPPGFRFYPSDEELVCHYLYKKVHKEGVSRQGLTMVEVDLHTCEPWELPEVAKLGADQWYFFSFRDRKYSTGSRSNRATKTGYWKATGKDRTVHAPSSRRTIVGMRKTLVFYSGRAPNGIKSSWVMHEFRLEYPYAPPTKEDWVLCRVFHKKKGEEDNNNNMTMMSQCPNSPTDVDYYSSSPPRQQMVGANLSLVQQQEEAGSTYHHEYCSSFFDVSTFLQCNYLDVDFPPQQQQQPQQQPFVAAATGGTSRGAKDHIHDMDYFGLNLDHMGPGIMDQEEAAVGFGNLEEDFRIQDS